jgi:hypothetical protein
MIHYDESDNPSNGWRAPDPDEVDDIENRLHDLEPGAEENPLEKAPLAYNPLNHAYPMTAETTIGVVEFMVQFTIIKGASNLPVEFFSSTNELQLPMSIEDVPVTENPGQSFFGQDFKGWANDQVNESALVSELKGDERYFLIPMIVRARRLVTGEPDATDTWEPLTVEQTAGLISGQALLDLILGYYEKISDDDNAPTALLDILEHFTGRYDRNKTKYPGVADEEWESGEEEWN